MSNYFIFQKDQLGNALYTAAHASTWRPSASPSWESFLDTRLRRADLPWALAASLPSQTPP